MAQYGAWSYAGSNGLRVGYDVAGDGVGHDTAVYHAHLWFYVNTQYFYSGDVQALNFAGWIGGSQGYTLSTGAGGVVLIAERDVYYTYTTYGSSPGNIQVSAQISGAYNGSTPSVLVDIPIPARPYAGPLDPTGVNAVRNSDEQATVTWLNNATAARPWTSVLVERQDFTPTGWGPWGTQAGVPGGSSSLVVQGLIPNRIFSFRVRSNNTVGSSAWVYSPWVYMTPGEPSNVASALTGGGSTITTTWTNNHYPSTATTLTVQRSVAGGAWVDIAAGHAWTVTSWVDPSPGGGANQYRVRAVNSEGGGTASAWATGNVVSTVVPPLAPTQLAPDGTAVDVQYQGVTLTWRHNPGADFAAQSHYSIEYSITGGSSWVALATNVASSVSSRTVAPGVLTNSTTPILWRVKTQGGTTAAFGPFSTAATITAHTTPTVTLDPLLPDDPTQSLPLAVRWFYNQDQGSPQTSWEATLFAADGTTILEQQSGTGATSQVVFAYPVEDGVTYVVAVRAMSGAGQWSALASATTTIDLPPPANVTLAAVFDPCLGTMALTLMADGPLAGEVPVEHVVVERRVAGGEWVVLISDLVLPAVLIDPLPLTNGLNEYRVTAHSSAPSFRVFPIVAAYGTDGQNPRTDGLWVHVSWGASFATRLRVHGDLDVQESPGRVARGQAFLGRAKPVGLFGANTSRQLSVSGSLRWVDPCPSDAVCRFDSPPGEWVTAGLEAEVVCYRDYTGRRVFGLLSGVQAAEGYWRGNASVQFTVTEMDFTELPGVMP